MYHFGIEHSYEYLLSIQDFVVFLNTRSEVLSIDISDYDSQFIRLIINRIDLFLVSL